MAKKYDFDKYKNYLHSYLARQGIELRAGANINCIDPAHDDKKASMQVNDDFLYCHADGKKFDIYDCVGIFEGITGRGEQFKHIDKLFGGGSASSPMWKPPATPKPEIEIEPPQPLEEIAAQKKVLEWLEKITALNKNKVFEFLDRRAELTSRGLVRSYPPEIREKLAGYLYYWAGLDVAIQELGIDTLIAAKILARDYLSTRKSGWFPSGVVVREFNGFKLFFYHGKNPSCEKRNANATSTFPQPYHELTSPLILVEGELDALACNAAGFTNVFAAGGVNGLSKPKIRRHLMGVKEIIFLFDNDDAGRKMSGATPLLPNEKFKQSIPEKLIQAGWQGKIRVASFLESYKHKDPDEIVLNNKLDDLRAAIENAKEYVPQPKTKKTCAKDSDPGKIENDAPPENYDKISLKHLKSLLHRIEFSMLDKDDREPFLAAAIKSCANPEKIKALSLWSEGQLTIDEQKLTALEHSPYLLLEMCDKYGVSSYIRKSIEAALIPATEIIKNIKEQKTIVEIDFEKIIQSENFKQFLMTAATDAAAALVIEVMDGRLKYLENDKSNWFFNGHIWVREPSVAVIISPILSMILKYYLQQNPKAKKTVRDLIKKVGGWTFRRGVEQNINGTKSDVWCESLPFDGEQIRGTLTLLDGVIDFSGKQIEYRKSSLTDYRREMLPYTVAEIKNAGKPEKFIEFMKGNFSDEKTLETLYYYLSLIPSRNTANKYGGIFIGKHNTGKSTTLNLIEAIFAGCCTRIKSEVLVSVGMKRISGNEATPEISKMDGKCAVFVQETARNAMLNTSFWKELTGGDTLTARGMWERPRDFKPTAQVIIASNYSPNFDAHDDAAISRMIVIPFKKQHFKTEKNSRTSDDFLVYLRPEFPAVVKFLVEKYIDLHTNLRGNIPLSTECENYKSLYVEEQKTDLDKFVEDCLTFDFSDIENTYEKVADVYARYLEYYSLSAESKEAMPRAKFTKILKRDYREIIHKQKRFSGGDPELVFFGIRLDTKPKAIAEKPAQKNLDLPAPAAPEDNPWSDASDDRDIF